MPQCVACGAELMPPVHAPHTVYAKSLYRAAGQDYCRHHIIRAAGFITEVKSDTVQSRAMARGMPVAESDSPNWCQSSSLVTPLSSTPPADGQATGELC